MLTVVTCALALGAIVALSMASAWYHDDGSRIAQWKCDAGDLGLIGVIVLGFSASLFALMASVAWLAHIVGRRGTRE